MGNVGNALNSCGVTDAVGFGRTTAGVIRMQGIEPWPARELVNENLARQAELARRHPLNQVPVEIGMNWFKDYVGGWFKSAHLTREIFVDRATELLLYCNVRHHQADVYLLYDIFDSMDYDGNGELSAGEWAGGLTVFFKGNVDQCIHAVFDILDANGDKSLSKSELTEYLKPFVSAMTPPEASALRPLLTKKAADDIFEEMDFDHNQCISSDEMLEWSQRGNNIIDKIAQIIEHEVYSVWLKEKDRDRIAGYSKQRVPIQPRGYAPPPQQSWQQRDPNRGQPYGGGSYGGSLPYASSQDRDPRQPYGEGYSAPSYHGGGSNGGGYRGQDPNDYRDMPAPPPYGSRGVARGPYGGY